MRVIVLEFTGAPKFFFNWVYESTKVVFVGFKDLAFWCVLVLLFGGSLST